MKIYKPDWILKTALTLLLTGAGAVETANAQGIAAGTSAITPSTQVLETGPILDVVPNVLSDGYTINLTLIPSLTEFNGYVPPPNIAAASGVGQLNVVQLPVVLPEYSVRQVITTVNIWDGQTVVLGGLITSQTQNETDKVPVIGDIPVIGKLFQSQTKQSVKKNLMIFVTATIVDPAGNRVHSEDELPFAQNSIPPQPPGAGQVTETTRMVTGPPQ